MKKKKLSYATQSKSLVFVRSLLHRRRGEKNVNDSLHFVRGGSRTTKKENRKRRKTHICDYILRSRETIRGGFYVVFVNCTSSRVWTELKLHNFFFCSIVCLFCLSVYLNRHFVVKCKKVTTNCRIFHGKIPFASRVCARRFQFYFILALFPHFVYFRYVILNTTYFIFFLSVDWKGFRNALKLKKLVIRKHRFVFRIF